MTYWSGNKQRRGAVGCLAAWGSTLQRLTPERAAGVNAVVAHLAQRMGMAPPAIYLAHPPYLPGWAGASAVRLTEGAAIWLSPASAAWPPPVLAAVLAHELGHIAAGHCRSPLAFLIRHGARLIFLAGLVLGDLGLVALTGLALVLAELAIRRHLQRQEQEADELAAACLSSVAPLLAMYAWTGPAVPWWVQVQQILNGYPRRRRWLEAMAARELLEMHRGANGSLLARERRAVEAGV